MIANRANLPEGRHPPVGGRGYGVAVPDLLLRHELKIRGLTGGEVAKRANVAPSTVSQALRGRRVHPRKLQAIMAALAQIEPIPDLVRLLGREPAASDRRALPISDGDDRGHDGS